MNVQTGSLEGLRFHNRARVVQALKRSGLASRADLTRATGLSRTTVSSLVNELLETGLVTERMGAPVPGPGSGGGRPPVLLALDRSARDVGRERGGGLRANQPARQERAITAVIQHGPTARRLKMPPG